MFNLDEYTTVAERIKLFWGLYPDGKIVTSIIEATATRFIVKTELWRTEADPAPFVTGHANEVISERGVNRDFALENAETSSIGVACKNAGIGTEKHAISREEASKVNRVAQAPVILKAGTTHIAGEPVDANDVWTINDAIGTVASTLGAVEQEAKPSCKHGERQFLTGVSPKTNKPYKGYMCPEKVKAQQCAPEWIN